jgi:hypothetical protein
MFESLLERIAAALDAAADRAFVRDALAEFAATLGEPLVERFDDLAGSAE